MDPQKIDVGETVNAANDMVDATGLQGWWTRHRRKLSTSLLAVAGVLVAVISVWAVQSGGGPAFTAGITVAKIVNKVETDRPGRSGSIAELFLPAVIGQDLLPGDGIRTFVNSEARIDIAIQDHTRVSRTNPTQSGGWANFPLRKEPSSNWIEERYSFSTTQAVPQARR